MIPDNTKQMTKDLDQLDKYQLTTDQKTNFMTTITTSLETNFKNHQSLLSKITESLKNIQKISTTNSYKILLSIILILTGMTRKQELNKCILHDIIFQYKNFLIEIIMKDIILPVTTTTSKNCKITIKNPIKTETSNMSKMYIINISPPTNIRINYLLISHTKGPKQWINTKSQYQPPNLTPQQTEMLSEQINSLYDIGAILLIIQTSGNELQEKLIENIFHQPAKYAQINTIIPELIHRHTTSIKQFFQFLNISKEIIDISKKQQ